MVWVLKILVSLVLATCAVAVHAAASQTTLVSTRYGLVAELPDGWTFEALDDSAGFNLRHDQHPDWDVQLLTERQPAAVEKFDSRFSDVMALSSSRYRLSEAVELPEHAQLSVHGMFASSWPVIAMKEDVIALSGHAPGMLTSLTNVAAHLIIEDSVYQCGVFYTLKMDAHVIDSAEAIAGFEALRDAIVLIARGSDEGCAAFRYPSG